MAQLASQRLLKTKSNKIESLSKLSILDYIPAVTPAFESPLHFKEAALEIDKILAGEQRVLCLSAGPRHGKSELIFHTIVKYLAENPTHTVAYCCYGAKLAESRSRNSIRPLAVRAGIQLSKEQRAAGDWKTEQGGGVLARGVEGAITGLGVNLIVIDDPYSNRAEAESPTIRQNVYDWFTSTAFTRGEPNASVIITHTRWHLDDLIGRVCDTNPELVTSFAYPVIKEDGTALWPNRYSIEDLRRIRSIAGEYDWASMYMQNPRPRGSGVFHNTRLYKPADIDRARLKIAVGLDLAYTAKTYSDWSVAVVLGKALDGTVYVLDVLRKQCSSPEFIRALKGLLAEYGWPPVFTYIGGTEKGVTDFFVTQGVKVRAEPAKDDKFVRAQPVSAAWNAGRIFLPEEASWLDAFTNEILAFTGVGDRHDDQVDALAGAFAQLTIPPPARGLGQRPIFNF